MRRSCSPLPQLLVWLTVCLLLVCSSPLSAQDHSHLTNGTTGLPHGIPDFCQAQNSIVVPAGAQAVWTGTLTAPCLGVHGAVTVADGARITGTVLVYADGSLTIGSASAPARDVVVTFPDVPLDQVNDPEQFGNGLIVFGRLSIVGQPKTAFVRLASEVAIGATALQLTSAPSGWQVGDRLALIGVPEVVTIASIAGSTVTLAQPAMLAHRGVRSPEGVLTYLPHVANLTRAVTLRSANPSGVRGHTIYTGRADVDIRGAAFVDLGRTNGLRLDSTTFDTAGTVTHLGTNQIGRYTAHFHHDLGPVFDGRTYQFQFIDNVMEGAAKWGAVIHNSHYGLIQDNVCFKAQGPCYVTEDGSETGNKFIGNIGASVHNPLFVMAPDEETYDPQGRKDSVFWFRAINQEVRNNVAADFGWEGYAWYTGCAEEGPCSPGHVVPIPTGPGLDPADPKNRWTLVRASDGQIYEPTLRERDPLPVEENEAYKGGTAFAQWWTPRVQVGWRSTTNGANAIIRNTRLWNVGVGILYRYTDAVFDGVEMLNEGGVGWFVNQMNDGSPMGLGAGQSEIRHATVRGVDIAYERTGQLSHAPYWTVSDSLFQTKSGFLFSNRGELTFVWPPAINEVTGQPDPTSREPHFFTFTNVKFTSLPNLPLKAITTEYVSNYTAESSDVGLEGWRHFNIQVQGYQNDSTTNFRVFFEAQHPQWPAPAPGSLYFGIKRTGCPESGLTNQQCWDRHGMATLMALAPCSTTTPGIVGYTCEVQPPPPLPPPQKVCGDGKDNDGDGLIDEGCAPPPPPPAPLTISALAPISVVSTNGLPIAVTYPTPSTTGGVAPVVLTCAPVYGSLFSVGTTTVTCTATDAMQTTATTATTVTVQSGCVIDPVTLTVTQWPSAALSSNGSWTVSGGKATSNKKFKVTWDLRATPNTATAIDLRGCISATVTKK